MLLVLTIYSTFPIIGGLIGAKNNSIAAGVVLGLLLGPLGVLLMVMTLNNKRRECPYCYEVINNKALKCPHCQSDIKPII